MAKKLILCDCLGSQTVDAAAISEVSGMTCSRVYTSLCEGQIDLAAKEISGGDVIIACQQERQRFEELAEELEVDTPAFVDLRDRAGWGEGNVSPKMAALVAEAGLTAFAGQMGKSIDIISEGTCLIISGSSGVDAVLQAAADLCETLAVTVLVSNVEHVPIFRFRSPPKQMRFTKQANHV